MSRRRVLEAAQFQVPLAMIDVFALSLMALILAHPQFLEHARLPALQVSDSPSSAPAGPPPIDVVVQPDGTILIDDAPCDVDHAPQRLREAGDPARPIRLLVHLDEEGRGGVESVIRLQLALSRADLMSRVFLTTARQADQ